MPSIRKEYSAIIDLILLLKFELNYNNKLIKFNCNECFKIEVIIKVEMQQCLYAVDMDPHTKPSQS